MATMIRIKARWSGFTGGPGYSVFYFRDFSATEPVAADATAAMARVRTFFDDIKINLPSTVNIQVESDVEVIEETTGALTDVLAGTPVAVVAGLASPTAVYAAAVGAVVTWRTGGIRNNRRIRGRTFLVPLSSTAFASDGTLSAVAVTDLSDAATLLRSAAGTPDLGVWARPTAIKDAAGNPTGAYNADGIWYVVASHSIPDMGAVLRSRRN